MNDIPVGTTGPTPSDDIIYEDHSSPPGAIKGGEVAKPGQMDGDKDKSPKDE
jgi:hypothetical protein